MSDPPPTLDFVLKVASRCNLNCSYCYVYNKGDSTWRDRPAIIPDAIFLASLERIRRHCLRSGQDRVHLTFHGGEPCLAGPTRFASWCSTAQNALHDITEVQFAIQTNGTLLDSQWVDVLLAHKVRVSISMDGPKDLHDVFRVNHRGGGSYDAVVRGIASLREAGIPLRILSVIQFGADGLRTHRHFLGLGARSVDYLLPDFTHDTIQHVRKQYGPTPCADYLTPILEDWWRTGSMDVNIGLFWHMSRLVLGGESQIDALGNRPFHFVFVETDGNIEGLDVLRVCNDRVTKTGLNVLRDDFTDIAQASTLHYSSIFQGVPLPTGCRACPERSTCGGGYLPHRYSRLRGFDNPSVWCEDLLQLFGRLRELLEVPTSETAARRQVLADMSGAAGKADQPAEARPSHSTQRRAAGW